MFKVTIGAITYDVQCPDVEQFMQDTRKALAAIEGKVDQLLRDATPAPRIRFIIGPTSEQKETRHG